MNATYFIYPLVNNVSIRVPESCPGGFRRVSGSEVSEGIVAITTDNFPTASDVYVPATDL